MYGVVYDQLGQMLSCVESDRTLYRQGAEFRAFNPVDDGIVNMEDGVMINKTWVESSEENKDILVRFLKVRGLTRRHSAPVVPAMVLHHLLPCRDCTRDGYTAGAIQQTVPSCFLLGVPMKKQCSISIT